MIFPEQYNKIKSPLPFLLIAIFICCISYSCSPESEAIPIENDKAQLFIDDYLIESSDNLKRTLFEEDL